MAYGLFYWVSRLRLGSLSNVILYMGYLLLFSLLDFLITGMYRSNIFKTFCVAELFILGTIGFLASYLAIRKLYSAIRVD